MSESQNEDFLQDFSVFILTYKRPQKQKTLSTLKEAGYSGKWYLVADDSDPTIEKLKSLYGEKVLVFNKAECKERHHIDLMDNFPGDDVVIYARYAVQDFAQELGLKHFLVLDDDYYSFTILNTERKKRVNIKDFDSVCRIMCNWLDSSENLKCVSFLQGGDIFGGEFSRLVLKGFKQKVMNAFFCSTEKPLEFYGRLNEDVNCYIEGSKRGGAYISTGRGFIRQSKTQQNHGGLTDAYLRYGTYVKSFYTFMQNPSCTEIQRMRSTYSRIHHKVDSDYAFPKIIRDDEE